MGDRDKRYQRTHSKIRQVFEELILTVPFQEITVSRISQEAGINRKTFYVHYETIMALLDELANDLAQEFQELDEICQKNSGQYGAGIIEGFFEILERRENLHRKLICAPEYLFVFQHISEQILKQHTARFQIEITLDEYRQRALTKFLLGSVMPIYRDWLLAGKPIPQKDLAQFLELLIQSCLDGLERSVTWATSSRLPAL